MLSSYRRYCSAARPLSNEVADADYVFGEIIRKLPRVYLLPFGSSQVGRLYVIGYVLLHFFIATEDEEFRNLPYGAGRLLNGFEAGMTSR